MSAPLGAWERALRFFVEGKLVVFVLLGILVGAGLYVLPFDVDLGAFPRDRVPVDAIPDIGENQQIVFTEWMGRSPRDVEDQITYPLTSALLGIPGVRTVRSTSAFGFSTIYVIFEDGVDFYWSRSRVLEKLASLPAALLPEGVAPTLGPDATALGQVFWYTLEGRDETGHVVGGWDPSELRSIQDWIVRYALMSVPGVSEVASVGGYVREYQVEVDPQALLANGVSLEAVARAVRNANLDVGARTVEINRVEYIVRSRGFVQSVVDLERAVVAVRDDGTPLRVGDVAHVGEGPALRRGALDDAGAPAVGGVVVARFGENPLAVIQRVRERIEEIARGLPRRTLEDGTVSQVHIVPFYDRTELIHQTLGTLSSALFEEILITVLVVLVFLGQLRSSLIVSSVLPLGVLAALIAMKATGVDANIMALGGIAIAIGTMVDMAIVLTENIASRLESAPSELPKSEVVWRAAAEVAPAVLTSLATTVASFLPVFALGSAEGKLFSPLAYTKSFAMVGALIVSLTLIPALADLILRRRRPTETGRRATLRRRVVVGIVFVLITYLLARHWSPLGRGAGGIPSFAFVALLLLSVLGGFFLLARVYERLLASALQHKGWTLLAATSVVLFGLLAWLGFAQAFAWLPAPMLQSRPAQGLARLFPGLGREFMPPFDEGSFLYMPTTMAHASIGEAQELLQRMDAAIAQVPEVDRVVGKLGRAESALDPAPVSMFEVVVTFVPEYREEDGQLVRNWREHIRSPADIWDEIARAGELPGLTSAPVLMPIAARIVMLQSGMRAPMGIKVQGPSLDALESFGRALEEQLRQVPAIRPETVVADRVVGKPYLEIEIDREAIARYGLSVDQVQGVIQVALGGIPLTRTVEGRERYPVSVRYMREERGDVEAIGRVLVPTPAGPQVPLEQLTHLRYVRGPQAIRSEDTLLTSYVLFDRRPEVPEVEAVEQARRFLETQEASGVLVRPEGVRYRFAGSYENQVRSERRLAWLVPLALSVVFLLLYLQFRRVSTTLVVYSGVLLSVGCAFGLLWLYGRPGFLDLAWPHLSLRELFRVSTVNMSVATWVGMIAVVGVATDNGVVLATYLAQRMREAPPTTRAELRARAHEAGMRRLRPCLMTTSTTLIALLPVITSQGRGADVMLPMALPSIGGMVGALMTLITVPVLYAWVEERKLSP